MPRPIAISVSDIHLSHRPPICRAKEPDWYGAMKRQIDELAKLALECGGVPIICAGDIFDKYDPPPQLINFALHNLPQMYAVPGQHDLAYHVYEDMHRTAYGTLKAAGKIIDLNTYVHRIPIRGDQQLVLYGFPWGSSFEKYDGERHKNEYHIAVVHKYVWKKGRGYPGADRAARVNQIGPIQSYDVCVFGDNHKHFVTGNVINNGSFFRRAIDDEHPMVTVIYEDLSVIAYKMNTPDEDIVWDVRSEVRGGTIDMHLLVEQLQTLGQLVPDFCESVKRYCSENDVVTEEVLRRLLRAMEGEGSDAQEKR